MQISSRFTIALHILIAVETFQKQYRVSSSLLAKSIQVDPVIIRKILLQLKAAGFILVSRGRGGIFPAQKADKITLLDIYRSIEPLEENKLFHFHENPNPQCPVGKNIHNILDDHLISVQKAMEDRLKKIKLSDVLSELNKFI